MNEELIENFGDNLDDFYAHCRKNGYSLLHESEENDGNIKTQCVITNQDDEEALLSVELNHKKSNVPNDMNKFSIELDLTISLGSISMSREELSKLQTMFENISGMKMNEISKAD